MAYSTQASYYKPLAESRGSAVAEPALICDVALLAFGVCEIRDWSFDAGGRGCEAQSDDEAVQGHPRRIPQRRGDRYDSSVA